MTTMISEVYEAFRSAGVPEDKARKAAEAMSSEATLTKGDIAKLDKEIAAVRSDITLLKWMVGVVMAGVGGQLVKSFFG
ncbi:MAG: hypothetical protein ACOYNF_07705 [Rhodoferax sp.]